jgi:hypothetical protein
VSGARKGRLIDELTRGAPTHVRKLVRDVLYGRVAIPVSWLGPEDASLLAIDAEAELDDEQAARCADLTRHALALFGIADRFIRDYIAAQRAGLRDFRELDSIRRGRGPAAVRNFLMQRLPTWPETVPEILRADVDDVLHDALEARRREQTASRRTGAELRRIAAPVLPDVIGVVRDWATAKHLAPHAADEVMSEVLDQLGRSCARAGVPPDDIRRWTLTTAVRKWRALASSPRDLEPVETGDKDRRPPGTSRPFDETGDEASGNVDATRTLLDAAAELRDLAEAYRRARPPREDDALSCTVAAELLSTQQIDLVIEVIRDTEQGAEFVARLLARRGRLLARGRRTAIARLVRDTLARIYGGLE